MGFWGFGVWAFPLALLEQIDLVLIDLLKESKRKRPIKSDTMKNMEKAFGNWGWRAGSTDDVDTANDDKGADDNKSED